jgi:hypothetical protein
MSTRPLRPRPLPTRRQPGVPHSIEVLVPPLSSEPKCNTPADLIIGTDGVRLTMNQASVSSPGCWWTGVAAEGLHAEHRLPAARWFTRDRASPG